MITIKVLSCKHRSNGKSAIVTFQYNGTWKQCQRCFLITERPARKTSWQSVKDYFRAWWTRHIIDDYDNLWSA